MKDFRYISFGLAFSVILFPWHLADQRSTSADPRSRAPRRDEAPNYSAKAGRMWSYDFEDYAVRLVGGKNGAYSVAGPVRRHWLIHHSAEQ